MDNILNQEDIEKIHQQVQKTNVPSLNEDTPFELAATKIIEVAITTTEAAVLDKLQVDDKELVEIINKAARSSQFCTDPVRCKKSASSCDSCFKEHLSKTVLPYLSQRIKDAKKEERERIYNDWINNGNLPTLKEE